MGRPEVSSPLTVKELIGRLFVIEAKHGNVPVSLMLESEDKQFQYLANDVATDGKLAIIVSENQEWERY